MIGLTKEGAHWDDTFIKAIQEKMGAYKVTCIDLPGSGQYMDQTSPTSIDKIAVKTRENYEELIHDQDHNILISISLGGMVGYSWVRQFPSDFSKFVIINSSFKNLSPLPERVQPGAILEFFKIFFSLSKKERDKKIIQLTVNNRSLHSATLDKWFKLASKRDMSAGNTIRQTFAANKFGLSSKPSIPTYVIAAKSDRLASFRCSEKLVNHWQCDHYFFESPLIGHALHIDAPKELAEKIDLWSQKQGKNLKVS